jgi:putative hydroxymethylpyrimidine transporter CytX
MENRKTSVLSNGLIWFGAAVSIAEILTGTFIAPLGFGKGLAAILLGHLIGCSLLYLAGLIGAKTERSAMETVKMSFGQKGSLLFSVSNVLQLVGWTAIMIVSGVASAGAVVRVGEGNWFWSIIIALLIIIWLLIGIKKLDKLNIAAMGGLFILTVILSTVVLRDSHIQRDTLLTGGDISFGAAVELSAAMPLSWLPLISDYTRYAKKKQTATFASAAVYFLTSSWMYVIGMAAALFTGESDISRIMLSAGLGTAGLFIVVFSTVTTTYLDAFSAGVSAVSITKKLSEKWTAVVVCVIGAALAVFTPVTRLEPFLYLIGSVFAPMIAILIVDAFILKKDCTDKQVSIANLILWAVGFVLYRLFMNIDTPVGSTLPVMVITALLCLIVNKIGGKK